MADTDTAAADDVDTGTDDAQDAAQATDDGIDWKKHSRKHERDAKKLRDELDQLRQASQSDQERALEQARTEAAEQARTDTAGAFQSRLLNAEIRAQAAGKFANPRLAERLLDIDPADVFDDNGDLDEKQIATAIDQFLAEDDNAGLRAGERRSRSTADAARGSADAGRGTGGTGGDMNDFIRTGSRRG